MKILANEELSATRQRDRQMKKAMDLLDHLVYATPDLAATVADLELQLGITASPGGQHPGRGTRNSLFSLGPETYLEIIGPDPDQPGPGAPRWFGIDSLSGPRLVAWAAKSSNLDKRVGEASACGITLGPLNNGRRQRPDGGLLQWRFTDPSVLVVDGVFPFFINWGNSAHPAADSVQRCRLDELRAEHPDADVTSGLLTAMGIALDIAPASESALIATLSGERGTVQLR